MDDSDSESRAQAFWQNRDQYSQHRSQAQISQLLGCGHIIPISHGYTAKFVAENYPGWSWNQLVEVLTAAGVFVNRGGAPPGCDPGVREVYFDSEVAWLVEWEDGRITAGQEAPGTTVPAASQPSLPVLDLATGKTLEDSPGDAT